MTRRKALAGRKSAPTSPVPMTAGPDLLLPEGFEVKSVIPITLPPEIVAMQRLAELQADINRRAARRHWMREEIRIMFMGMSSQQWIDDVFSPYSSQLVR